MIRQFIEDKCGIKLGEEKALTLESKLVKMLAESVFDSFEELYEHICLWNDPIVIDEIIDSITVNETFWFRDKTPWMIMEGILLPEYVREFREGRRSRVRIWSAACSYGQEPYSIAMCIDNYLESHGISDIDPGNFEILATDISRTALQMAEAGRYDNISIQRGLAESYRYKYFENQGRIWKLCDRIKDAVSFRQFNLINDFSGYGLFDIVFFRNVLIYFSDKLKKEMIQRIRASLFTGGALFIGSAELFTDPDRNFVKEQYMSGTYFKSRE